MFYNDYIEDLSTRLLYLMNTLDSYFIIIGVSVWAICLPDNLSIWKTLFAAFLAIVVFRIADFHPYFILFSLPAWFVFFYTFQIIPIGKILLLNLLLFIFIQYFFMGIPNSIISRDIRVGFIMLFNSLFTVAPTAVSFSMSYFFSTAFSFILIETPLLLSFNGIIFWLILFFSSGLSFVFRKKNFSSEFGRWPNDIAYFKRVVVLNIDGCRFDFVKSEKLPYMRKFQEEGGYYKNGLRTIYRALTNPAFASILTGVPPNIHKVKSNLYGQVIKVEGLPDFIPSILYGSMHVRHFSKSHWETKIVSLPTYSIYKSDEIVFDRLKNDIKAEREVRLFIVDLSEVDFLGHCYGGYTRTYKKALRRTDERIGKFVEWCKSEKIYNDTAIIVCSDHGMACIDHSYLLFYSETYVPFFVVGKNISPFCNSKVFSIMNIANTICYLLGERYPSDARGKFLVQMGEQNDDISEKFTAIVKRTFHREANIEESNGFYLKWLHDELDRYEIYCSKYFDNQKPLRILILDKEGIGFFIIKHLEKIINVNSEIVYLDKERVSEELPNTLLKLSLVSQLQYDNSYFDLVLSIGAMHHSEPESLINLIKNIDYILKDTGYVIGSMEPNQAFLDSLCAKTIGYFFRQCEIKTCFPASILHLINERLTKYFKQPVKLHEEELLHFIEDHSPLGGNSSERQPQRFDPEKFFSGKFPNCSLLELDYYFSTFLSWQKVSRIIGLNHFLNYLSGKRYIKGNLFSYVIRKNRTFR